MNKNLKLVINNTNQKTSEEYFFEKGEMVVNGTNISDIVFLKKNA